MLRLAPAICLLVLIGSLSAQNDLASLSGMVSDPNGAMVELRFFLVREYRGEIENRIFRDLQWSAPRDLASYDFLEADASLVKDLVAGKLI